MPEATLPTSKSYTKRLCDSAIGPSKLLSGRRGDERKMAPRLAEGVLVKKDIGLRMVGDRIPGQVYRHESKQVSRNCSTGEQLQREEAVAFPRSRGASPHTFHECFAVHSYEDLCGNSLKSKPHTQMGRVQSKHEVITWHV